jgi:hypothetical protein
MKKCFLLLVTGLFLAAVGCDKQETHPSGAVDTSDPNKTHGTMTPLPKGSNDPTKLVGVPKTGPAPKAP